MKDIEDLLETIERNRIDVTDMAVDDWAGERLEALYPDLLKFQRENAYVRYLLRYVSEYEPEDNDGKPPCTCSNHCPPIRGTLPARVKEADDPSVEAEEWALEHNGEPHALKQAEEQFLQDLSDLYRRLRRVNRGVRTQRIIEPTDGDAEAETDASAGVEAVSDD